MNSKDVLHRAINGVHRTIFRVSGGRVGGKGAGMPVVELTTTGRKSGKKRSTMLTSPVHDDERVVLVASFGGDDRNPAWFLNLRDSPDVTITMEGKTRDMRARVATPDEKVQLWPQVVEANKGYAGYQEKTDRDIPLVILEP